MKFGYTIQRDNQIDLDKNDLSMYYEVRKKEPSVLLCMACGTCASTCSAAQFTDFSLRRIILQLSRGEITGMAEEVSKCMLCGKCQMACPRGVNTRNIILTIKTITDGKIS